MNIRQTQLPEGWEIKMLGDLFEITSSKRVFKEEWKTEGVPFYRAREIVKLANNGSVNNELFISEEMFNKYSERYGRPNPNDIMVTGVGTLGICYVVKSDDRFYFKDGNIIWLKSKGKANSRYVEYAFKADFLRKQIDDSVGATVGTYTIIKAKSTKIPIPPLPEQQRIVSLLDECFLAIERSKKNADQNLKNAKELYESYLQGLFESGNWDMKELGDLCTLITKGSSPKWQGINYVEEPGILFVTSENVGEGKMLLDTRKYVESKFNLKDKKSILKKGDVLTNIVGASIGRTAIYDIDDVANINQAVCILRCNPDLINNNFLMNLLNSPFLKKILHDNEVNTARANLSLGFFNKLLIPTPSIIEQQSIVRKLDALHAETQKLEAIYQKKLNDLEDLKKSILQKAFAGELKTEKLVQI